MVWDICYEEFEYIWIAIWMWGPVGGSEWGYKRQITIIKDRVECFSSLVIGDTAPLGVLSIEVTPCYEMMA